MKLPFSLKCLNKRRREIALATSFAILVAIFGENLPPASSKFDNFSIPIFLIRLVSDLAVDSDSLLFENRKQWNRLFLVNDEETADNLTFCGFKIIDECSRTQASCPSCEARVDVDRVRNSTTRFQALEWHQDNCDFKRLAEQIFQVENATATKKEDAQLMQYLKTQTVSSKFELLVKEYGYSADLVCAVVVRKFLHCGPSIRITAGDLAGDLFDIFNGHCYQRKDIIMLAGLHEFIASPNASFANDLMKGLALELPISKEHDFFPMEQQNAAACIRSISLPVTEKDRADTRKKALLKETISMLVEMMCKQCCKREAKYLIIPCGHVALCEVCLETAKICPLCDGYKESVSMIFRC